MNSKETPIVKAATYIVNLLQSIINTKGFRVLILIITIYIITYVELGIGLDIFPCKNADKINTILLNLSYSYIAALIFAWIWEHIPQICNEKKAFKINESNINSIYRNMHELITSLMMVYKIDKDIFELNINDLSQCNIYKPDFSFIYYEKYIIKGNNKETKEKGIFSFWEDLEDYSTKIKKTIIKIKNLPSSTNLSLTLINLLSEIEQDELLGIYNAYKTYPDNYKSQSTIYHFDEKIFNFIQLYKRMGNISSIKFDTKMRELSDKAIIDLKVHREIFINELKSYNKFPQNGLIYHNYIRYKIKDGKVR